MTMKRMTTMKDRVRRQVAEGRLQRLEQRRRDLDGRMERLKGELTAEREARVELASLVKEVGRPSERKPGLIRLAAIGGLAYVLGARAGRQRYQQIVMKSREGINRAGVLVGRAAGSLKGSAGAKRRGMWMDRPDRSGMSDPEGVMMR